MLCIMAILLCSVALLYWRQHRFIQQLTHSLQLQLLNQDSFNVDSASASTSLKPLINVLQDLHQSSIFSTERDKLTGLANRVGFKRKMLSKMPMSDGMLVLIDIRQFRFVNDLFGFLFGDKFLKAFAKRIDNLNCKAQFIARMNGNEFLLFFHQKLTVEQLLEIKSELQRPFEIEQQPISIKIQLGVLSLSEHHAEVSLMLRRLGIKKSQNIKAGRGIL